MGLGTIFSNIQEKIQDLLSGFTVLSSIKDRIKIDRKIVLIIAGALSVVIVLLLVLVIITHQKNVTKADYESSGYSDAPILYERLPAEDFFLPYEPDFVPDVLLEREPKDPWTEEDTRPYWTNPLDGNEAAWRKRIESGIDSLLEQVP